MESVLDRVWDSTRLFGTLRQPIPCLRLTEDLGGGVPGLAGLPNINDETHLFKKLTRTSEQDHRHQHDDNSSALKSDRPLSASKRIISAQVSTTSRNFKHRKLVIKSRVLESRPQGKSSELINQEGAGERGDEKEDGPEADGGDPAVENMSLEYGRVQLMDNSSMQQSYIIKINPPPRRLGGKAMRPWTLSMKRPNIKHDSHHHHRHTAPRSLPTPSSSSDDKKQQKQPPKRMGLITPTTTTTTNAMKNSPEKETNRGSNGDSAKKNDGNIHRCNGGNNGTTSNSCGKYEDADVSTEWILTLAHACVPRLLPATPEEIQRAIFALASYIGTCTLTQRIHGWNLCEMVLRRIFDRIDSDLKVTREKERLSRDQFNELSLEAHKSKETVKISRRLNFLTTKTEPIVKTLDQQREERALALKDLERIILLRNTLERQHRYLRQFIGLFSPKVEDQNYQIMLKLINDGCLRDSFSLKMEIRLADILRVLVSCAICEKAAMQRLWDATNAANLVEKHLVDFVSASWK
eukprot:jgi/Bigna1/70438/fgenesh1_pg.12_\